MKRLLLLFFTFLLGYSGFTQTKSDSIKLCKNLYQQADILASKGAFKLAISKFKNALTISSKCQGNNHINTIKILTNIGNLNTYKGDFDNAIKVFKQASSKVNSNSPITASLKLELANINNGLGIVYKIKRNIDSSRIFYKQALEIKQQILEQNHISIANSYNNLANLEMSVGNYRESVKYQKKNLQIILKHKGQKHFLTARSYNNLARTFTLSNQNDSALYYYQKALIANNKTFSSSKVSDLPTKESAFINNSIAFETLYRKSELLKDSKMIIAHITLADFLAKNIRKSLTYRSEKINFLRRSGRFFESALTKIYQLYSKTTKDKQSLANLFFYFSERSKANVLLDQIAQDNQERIPIISLPETQQKLQGRNLAILSYVFAQGTLYVSIISGKKVQILPLLQNTTRKKLRYITNKLQSKIQSFDIMAYFEQATKAYNKLLAPPIKQLSLGTKRVLLIPTPDLSGVPWEGLPMQSIAGSIPPMKAIEVAKYVIRKYDLYHHFSVSLAFRKQIKNTYPKTYLGLGIGSFFGKLPELKQSTSEVIGVAELLTSKGITKSQVDVYTNKAVTKQRLSSKSKIIHLSTHGEYRQRNKSQLTGLYLCNQSKSTLDTLTTQDIYQNKEFEAELVILSGCHSRRGRIARYEGVIGFERVLIQKGVKFILSSSWKAYDEPSRELLSLFFKYLNTQKWDYNAAWMKAKREFIKKPQLPGTWAGLVLIGLLGNG